jgi:uncharacterized protein
MNKYLKKSLLFVLIILASLASDAYALSDTTFVESRINLQTATGIIFGTLTKPDKSDNIPVAIILAGSGSTDRDGNNPTMKNNSLKMLAYELAKNGIASLRYDKRGIAVSKSARKIEINLRFDDYINDAKEWIQLLKQDKRFSQVVVIGHNEGSLIGMVAATTADKFISIAGAGQSADKILKEQLSNQSKMIQDMSFPIIYSLKNEILVDSVPPMLYSLFRKSVQPYLISWFKYNPQDEIRKLSIPILILQGTNDIQISVEDARLLSNANPNARLILIENMNHILRHIEGDRKANLKTYNDPTLPIDRDLVKNIVDFILKN